ncbi:hypothetical protein [Neolewinella agarilytica]|uniref:Outer membrane protein beta-barrel domain-containing protein n=1 Tax=Neolewinella agarilytica TaxID=478744 RepID=A0A1H9MCS4_9BACT|nr:hypothetical protein [Neolewinella agarilytica]SER21391.1 hypothetical protein SAMN05444359_12849 [Neolewinella agarilytica]
MKLFEDYIRRHFREATSTEEIDADDLWADIEAGLPPENEEEPVAGSPFRGVVLSLLLGGLILAGLLLWPFGGQQERALADLATERDSVVASSEPNLPAELPKLATGSAQEAMVASEMESVKTGSQPATPSASSGKHPSAPAGPAPQNASASNETKVESTSPSGATTGRTRVERNAAAGTTASATRSIENEAERLTLLQLTDLPASQSTASAEGRTSPSGFSNTAQAGVEKEVDATAALSARVSLPSLAIEPLSLDENLPAFPEVSFSPPSPETFRTAGAAKLEFSASAGTSLMLRKYLNPSEGNAANALNAAVGNTFGQSVSLELSYRLSNKFRLNTGLEYWRTHNTFRYTIERDTVAAHPSFPYRTTAATSIRRIAHNNYQQFLSLPVLLEYRQTFGRYTAGLGAGVGLNYQLQASGRTLAAPDEVITYDSSSGDTSDFFLSYRLRPSLMFSPRPNSRTRLLLQADVHYYRFGESSVTGLRQRAVLLGGSIGITYGL